MKVCPYILTFPDWFKIPENVLLPVDNTAPKNETLPDNVVNPLTNKFPVTPKLPDILAVTILVVPLNVILFPVTLTNEGTNGEIKLATVKF